MVDDEGSRPARPSGRSSATRLKTGIEALAVGGVATELAALSALIRSGQ